MKIDDSESPEIIVPLGKALKEARLQASLSVDEVAKILNLGPCTVRDLEDELDSVLETQKYPVIYLRGYLANYAKLVGLNTLELFVEYQQLQSVQKTKKTLSSPNLIIPLHKKRSKLLPVILVVIIVTVVIGVLFSLLNKPLLNAFQTINSTLGFSVESEKHEGLTKRLIISENISSESQSTEVESTDANETTKPVDASNKEIDKNTDENSDKNIAEDDVVQIVEPIEVIEAVSIADVSSEPAQQVEASFDAFEATASNTENDVEDLVEETIEEELPAGPEALSLAFNADCWTEIVDATGERIAFGLYKNGRVLMLTGMAPFQLKLGDPSVVEIQYQDQIIEGEFAPGRSAQFSVPLS